MVLKGQRHEIGEYSKIAHPINFYLFLKLVFLNLNFMLTLKHILENVKRFFIQSRKMAFS
jgi:hypothetical protein